ncbi:DUF6392 family protein [Pseudomonas syringae]|uniref:Immunity protein n=1 Tax=Pseudomonas syringae TaxID=317 RepID=A0A085VR58_PSESX|nr:DUF6392 family protein [Pseudomonas syringae]KFE57921.1 hypothetical protein IV01_00965 [Pseudomonas syringae]
MSASTIESWIKHLGQTHEYLLSESLIPGDEVVEVFPGDDDVYLEPEKGISMKFCDDDGRFESFTITLVKLFPEEHEYKGELPTPYNTNMNKLGVHDLFGLPYKSAGPAKIPHPTGSTGGWDSYPLDQSMYPNVEVVFHYLKTTQVDYIAFGLIDKGHD